MVMTGAVLPLSFFMRFSSNESRIRGLFYRFQEKMHSFIMSSDSIEIIEARLLEMVGVKCYTVTIEHNRALLLLISGTIAKIT